MAQSAKNIPQPTGPELEVLGILWASPKPLKLSEIHSEIEKRRTHFGDPVPAMTTVSSTLRNAVTRGLLSERRIRGGEFSEVPNAQERSTLHTTRSPQTAYVAGCEPDEALLPIFRILVEACPPDKRVDVLLELIKQMKLDLPELKRLHHELKSK